MTVTLFVMYVININTVHQGVNKRKPYCIVVSVIVKVHYAKCNIRIKVEYSPE